MAVSLIFGKTESGKSTLARKIMEKKSRTIVLDVMRCFSGGDIVTDISKKKILELLEKYKKAESFCIIFQPSFKITSEVACEYVCSFAFALGRTYGERALEGDSRIVLVLDEADTYATKSKDSATYKLVNYGRHYNVDALAICREPERVPTYFRRNASTVYSFNLKETPELKSFFQDKTTEIPSLKKYYYYVWKDNCDPYLIDDKGRKK